MKKIWYRLYPENQLRRYLFIDIVLCVFLFYNALSAGSPVGLPGTFLLLALFSGPLLYGGCGSGAGGLWRSSWPAAG